MKPARPDDIPRATHEGVMELLGMKLRTYRLDDGRTVIHADDFHEFPGENRVFGRSWARS
jgi:hypothetical protein